MAKQRKRDEKLADRIARNAEKKNRTEEAEGGEPSPPPEPPEDPPEG